MDKPIPEAVRQLTMIRDGYAAGPIVQAEKVSALGTAIEALTAAQQQGQAVAWEYLGTSSLAGPWPTAEWKPCDDPDAARAAGYEVRQKPMQQGGGEVCPHTNWDEGGGGYYCSKCEEFMKPYGDEANTAPPSAPVGVEDARVMVNSLARVEEACRQLWNLLGDVPPHGDLICLIEGQAGIVRSALERAALAQQPAAVAPRAWLCTFGEVSGVTTDPKWRDMCARLGQQITPLVPALARQPAAVDEAMVERAALAYEAEVDGDTHSPNVPREAMRAALNAALATQHQEPTNG